MHHIGLPLHSRCPYRLGSCGTGLPGPKPRSRRCSLGTRTCVLIIIFFFIVINHYHPPPSNSALVELCSSLMISYKPWRFISQIQHSPYNSFKPISNNLAWNWTTIGIVRQLFCIVYYNFHDINCTWFPQLLHATGHPVNIHPGFLVHSPIRAHVAQYLGLSHIHFISKMKRGDNKVVTTYKFVS